MKYQNLLVGIILFAFIINTNAQLTIKDQSYLQNTLLIINAEGNGGSVTIPSIKAIIDPTFKLYNLKGNLHWNGSPIGSSNVSSLNDLSDAKFDGSSLFLGEGSGSADNGDDNYNVGLGSSSLNLNTSGTWNTACGYEALSKNIDGNINTAIGYQALNKNTSGYGNTASGCWAMLENTTGWLNTAIGYRALEDNTIGNYNLANGYLSLCNNTSGNYNIACGYYALRDNISGDYNTAIGYDAGPYREDLYNTTSLGRGACPTRSNEIRIGNEDVIGVVAYGPFVDFSDGRFKRNIKENVRGLDFVMGLRPVTFNIDVNGIAEKLGSNKRVDEYGNISKIEPSLKTLKSRAEKERKVQTGFIAQEVEQLANNLGIEFSGVYAPKNEDSMYGLSYSQFVVPLVKAVQEQQEIIESLTKRIAELEKREK